MVERIVDVISLIVLMGVVLFVHRFPEWVVQSGAVMLAGAAGLLVALVAFKRGETKTARLLQRLLRPLPQAVSQADRDARDLPVRGVAAPIRAGTIWSSRCFSTVIWSAYAGVMTPACRPFT